MDEFLLDLHQELPAEQAKEICRTLAKVFGNILANPSEPKFRTLKKDNKSVAERICISIAAVQLLIQVGFEDHDESYCCPENSDLEHMRIIREGLENATMDLDVLAAPAQRSESSTPQSPSSSGNLLSPTSSKGQKARSLHDFKRREDGVPADRTAGDLKDLRQLQRQKFKEFKQNPYEQKPVMPVPDSSAPDSPAAQHQTRSDATSWLLQASDNLSQASKHISNSLQETSVRLSEGFADMSTRFSSASALSCTAEPAIPCNLRVIYRSGALVRKGVGKDSPVVDVLRHGTLFVGVEKCKDSEGGLRIRLEAPVAGWVSFKRGVMQEVHDEDDPAPFG